ncbi:ArdC family protein [Algoriphagus pacificus]|uniref:DUF1738 domain-containing protein n=1 Tax=Algoriphagus pacificus TaxID=2811234 RepID=A0ABS3CL68_9BACT|nr:zincin-like metallopeptidase domain-containing protein [Algoriphagus pacificus]MBN7816985.1 DUF1738 domain-containing protein [Algoriphagus pacificus]
MKKHVKNLPVSRRKGWVGNRKRDRQMDRGNGSDIYRKFTDLILAKMEEGIIPWRKPWNEMGMPTNYLTRRPYKGINLWVLLSMDHKYPYYLTFNQVNSLGGKVRKGAKSCPICFWNFSYSDRETGKRISEKELVFYPKEQIQKSGFLKEYRVFPIEQIEGIDWDFLKPDAVSREVSIDPCEKILENMLHKPTLRNHGNEAYYRVDLDEITMPEKHLFAKIERYYGVLFHELIHSTGHESRLNRKGVREPHLFGSKEYRKEELIAEMGAGFLNNQTGILSEDLLDNSVAYIQNWMAEFRKHKQLLIHAAHKAQKAVEYILMDSPF